MLFSIKTSDLLQKKCRPQHLALTEDDLKHYLVAVDGWVIEDGKLSRRFDFSNFYQTMAFANAVAFVAHAEDHHPEMTLTYPRCTVRFHTHSVGAGKGGITENDFICAAKIDAVFDQCYVQ